MEWLRLEQMLDSSQGREQAKLIADPNERLFVLVANGFTLQFDMFCRELIALLMRRDQVSVSE